MKVRPGNISGSCGGGGGGRSRVSISLLLLSLGTLFCTVLFAESAEGKVRCYVCSWQSPSAHGGKNMTDTCSHYNFDESVTQMVECDGGCEAVSIRKSKNGKIVNFYKNCKSMSKNAPESKEECTSMENESYQYVTTCECTSDLCNTAGKIHSHHEIVTTGCIVLPILIVPYLRKMMIGGQAN